LIFVLSIYLRWGTTRGYYILNCIHFTIGTITIVF
jgi:hypothetical protein